MHEDVQLLQDLHDADKRLADAEHRLAKLQAVLPAAEAQEAQARDALEAARQAIAECKQREHAGTRKVTSYKSRRATAIRSLETGVGDSMAAERQVAQCEAILDETETVILEILEEADGLNATAAAAQADLEAAIAAVAAAKESLATEGALVQAEVEACQAAREAARPPVARDLLARYDLLKKRKGTAVTTLVGDACRSCRIAPNVRTRADFERGLLVSCASCGRWLTPNPL